MRMLFIYGESLIFSDQISNVSKLLLSDARILKQGTVMTLHCFSVNLKYVISITSNIRSIIYRPNSILLIDLPFIWASENTLAECSHFNIIE